MRVSRNDLHITCHPDGRTTVKAGDRFFDAEKVTLKTPNGKTIAVHPTCSFYALPGSVRVEVEPNGELFSLSTMAKKVRRSRKSVQTYLKHRRIGRKFGGEKLFTEADVWEVGREMPTNPKKAAGSEPPSSAIVQ